MPRAARASNSILGRSRGTHRPQAASTFTSEEASASAPIVTEALGAVSNLPGYHRSGEGRLAHPAARAGENPAGPSVELPPGIVVFRPPPKAPRKHVSASTGDYPRFVRQLTPDEGRLVLPDPETGRWPRLHAGAIATPSWARRAVPWSNRPPSRAAFAQWIRDSRPAEPEPELMEAAE
jgi:hypothetical protein